MRTNALTHRGWLVCAAVIGTAMAVAGTWADGGAKEEGKAPVRDDTAAESLGWKLGIQAWTYRGITLFETIDKCEAMGVKYLEMYGGQRLSPEVDARVGHSMSDEHRQLLKAKLKEAGVTLLSYGVVGLSKDEKASRAVFEFAKDMGIRTIVSEPRFDAYDTIEKLADEYKINVAMHNHPRPNRYWEPKIVLEHVDKRSQRLGGSPDTGHWMRSNVDPVEGVKLLRGRLHSVHLKQPAVMGERRARDVPFGQAKPDHIKAIMLQMRKQGYQGPWMIEYEHQSKQLDEDVAACIRFFDEVCREIAAEKEEDDK